jgi:hypothetical protein
MVANLFLVSLLIRRWIQKLTLFIGRLGVDLFCPEWLLPSSNFRDNSLFRNFPCRVQRERDIAI